MDFNEQFPSLKDCEYEYDLGFSKLAIEHCCLDKQKVREAMNFEDEDFFEEIQNNNYDYNEIIEAYKERLSKELGL